MFSITTDARVYENADPKDRNLPPAHAAGG